MIARSIVLLVLVLAAVSSAPGQSELWQRTNGPEGCWIYSIAAVSDARIIAVGAGGMFTSTDGGVQWSHNDEWFDTAIFERFELDNGRLFATGGLFSDDGGVTWSSPKRIGNATPTLVTPIGGDSVVTGLDDGHVALSIDHGATWKVLGSTIDEPWSIVPVCVTIASDGAILAAGTSMTLNYGMLYRSTDGGGSWSKPLATPSMIVALRRLRSGTLIAGTVSSGGFRSVDAGATWAPLGQAAGRSIGSIVDEGSATLLATELGALRSTDDGVAWSTYGSGLDAAVQALARTPSGRLFAATTTGVARLDDDMTWRTSRGAITGAILTSLAELSDGQIAVAANGGALYVSSDQGALWRTVNTAGVPIGYVGAAGPMATMNARVAAGPGGMLFLAISSAGVYVTGDLGATWRHPSGSGAPRSANDIDVDGAAVMVGADSMRVHFSTDGGTTWIEATIGDRKRDVSAVAIGDDGWLYAATGSDEELLQGGLLFRSRDGVHWEQALEVTGNSPILTIHAFGRGNVIVGTEWQSLFHSTDYGASWDDIDSGLFDGQIFDITSEASGVLVASGALDVYFSGDGGRSWDRSGLGFEDGGYRSVSLLLSSDQRLYAATDGNGVFRRLTRGMLAAPGEPTATPRLRVGPVPAHAELSMSATGATGDRLIRIVDMRGEVVARFPLGGASGTETVWSLDGVARGVYTCQLIERGRIVEHRRVVVE